MAIKDKLNIVFKPFFLALIGLVIGYSFVHWGLFIELGIFQINENITEIVVPLLIAGIVTRFLIHPKVKALRLRTPFIYSLVAWFGLSIPTIIAQKYMVTATGKLTVLYSIEEINNYEPTKYYKITSYHINTKAKYYYATYDVSGRNSEYFNMYLYAVMPIYERKNDITFRSPSAWLGISYEDRISNRTKHERKEEAFNQFIRQSRIQTENGDFFSFACFERIGKSSKDYSHFQKVLDRNEPNSSERIILEGMREPYEYRSGNDLQRLLTAMLIVTLLWLLMTVIPKIDKKELKRIKAGEPDKMEQIAWQETLYSATPHEGFFITPLLIYVNIGVFLLMALFGSEFFSFQVETLLKWAACYGPMVKEGEWWRLLTATFLHSGVMHLITNMVCLVVVGIELEERMSRTQYLLIYLLSGLIGSITSVLWHTPPVVGVGASGAIFGLYGAFVALLLTKAFSSVTMKSLLKDSVIFIGANLLIGIAPGIDNAAHIGGLIGGFVLASAMLPFLKKQKQK
ncbi:MAG: rhomboid family intramembrane serine protease [Porphyromonas sp.]|nr:rhomboid family intramembrane serine protease [Porphyromonas sp.]